MGGCGYGYVKFARSSYVGALLRIRYLVQVSLVALFLLRFLLREDTRQIKRKAPIKSYKDGDINKIVGKDPLEKELEKT